MRRVGTPLLQRQRTTLMISKKSWQRLTLSMIGLFIVQAVWMQAITHLYHLPPEALAAFTTITVNSQYVTAAIVIFMVTGRLVYEWKMNTASTVIERGEQIRQEFIDRTPAPKHFDDDNLP